MGGTTLFTDWRGRKGVAAILVGIGVIVFHLLQPNGPGTATTDCRVFTPGVHEYVAGEAETIRVLVVGGGGPGSTNGGGDPGEMVATTVYLQPREIVKVVVGGPGQASRFGGDVLAKEGGNRYGGEVVSKGDPGIVIVSATPFKFVR